MDQVFKNPSTLSHHHKQIVLKVVIRQFTKCSFKHHPDKEIYSTSLAKYLLKVTKKKQNNKPAVQQPSFEEDVKRIFLYHKCEFQLI